MKIIKLEFYSLNLKIRMQHLKGNMRDITMINSDFVFFFVILKGNRSDIFAEAHAALLT